MSRKVKTRAERGLIAFLLAAGLVMPLLGVMDRSMLSPARLMMIAGIVIAFEAASLHRAAGIGCAAMAVGGILIWLFSGGTSLAADVLTAVTLRIRGIETAIPLIAEPTAVMTTAAVTLTACLACVRKATCLPALGLCLAASAAVWLDNAMDLIPWLLPAYAAALTLMATDRFEETPVGRVLPVAAVIVAAAFLIAGPGMVSEPLKEKADEIRQSLMDRLFFTEARDVFTLYSEGYSPQGTGQLGGKPNPTDHPVMQVETGKVTYLKGTTYNEYDGHGWKNTIGGRRYLWDGRRFAEERSAVFDQGLPAVSGQHMLNEPQRISVRMLADSASTIFAPQRVREMTPGGEVVLYFSDASEIFTTRNLQAGDTWTLEAPLYSSQDYGIGALVGICATLEDPQYEKAVRLYTGLPGHLEQRIYDLARDVTAVAEAPFEKAMALQNWLSRNFRYTLDVGEHPENIDFVTSFLLDTRKGYCTYFASAMTILCRMAGLPARYVEGYIAEPEGNGEAIVTGMDAHAWTEVYFRGFGWLTFDATPRTRRNNGNGNSEGQQAPGEQEPTQPPEEPTAEPSAEPEAEPENMPEAPEESKKPETPEEVPESTGDGPEEPEGAPEGNAGEPPEKEEQEPKKTLWWLWLILAAAAGAAGVRIAMTSPGLREKRAGTEEERFEIWRREIEKLLAAENLVRKNGESPMAFMRRVDRTGIFSVNLGPSGECVSLIRYSKTEALDTDTGLLRDTATLLRGEVSRPAKLRYWLRRIFVPDRRKERKKLVKTG